MEKRKSVWENKTVSITGLLLSTAVLGSGFVVQKFGLEDGALSPSALLFGRCALAAAILGILFFRRLKAAYVKGQWKPCLAIGALYTVASFMQTYGLVDISPGNSAFLTSTYVVIIPFIWWAIRKERPDRAIVTSCLLALAGVGVLSLTEGLGLSWGDGVTLLGAVVFAFYIVSISLWAPDMDGIVMTFLLNVFAALFSLAAFLVSDRDLTQFAAAPALLNIAYMGVFFTGIALSIQVLAQRYLPAGLAGILLSMESLFGAFFGVVFGYNRLTPRFIIGGVIMVVAVMLPAIANALSKTRDGGIL